MEKIILDKYQKKVIKNKSKNLLVIAGAGSGKTLTIIYKIKHLIKKGILPSEILCITFTKAAALNLQNKLKHNNIYINVKTFHSLGYEIIKNTQNVTLIKENILDNLIIKKLKTYPKLTKIINVNFTEFGKGKTENIKNNLIQNTEYLYKLKDIIKTFINLFKSNNYNINKFKTFHQKNKKEHLSKTKIRHKLFLNLTKTIYLEYQEYLKYKNQIDFQDMINKAIEIVQKEGIYPYKYIIIDEYQDSSVSKCKLIQTIQNKTNAHLIAVGDDWQSIYQFTGSNLEIFINFKKYFPKAKIIKLKKTYRNSKELLKITSKFIMQNKNQIKKRMSSDKNNRTPVTIYYYNDSPNEIWNNISQNIKTQTLILGRNNNDINKLSNIKKNMQYMTVHKSKGLEANQVIIINLENSVNGFPSKIKNSEYLKYVTLNENNYDEERRLFYVALTRTKNSVILLVNKQKPSFFVEELLKQSNKYIKIIDINSKIMYNEKRPITY